MERPSGVRVVQLGFACLLYALGFGLVLFLLPFMAYDVSSSLFAVGVLIALPALSSMLSAIPAGGLVDMYGRRRVLFTGLLAMIALMLCLPYASTPVMFVLFVCLLGVAFQMIYAPLKAYLLEISPPNESSKYYGIIATGFQAGLALGPIAGGILLYNGLASGVAYASRFFALDLVLITLLFLSFRGGLAKTVVRVRYSYRKFLVDGFGEYLKLGRLGFIVLWLTVLYTTCEGLVWTLEPLFSEYYRLNAFTAGLILSMFLLPFVLFNIPAGMLADRYGKMRLLIPSLTLAGIFLVIFGLAKSTPILVASAFLSTTGLAFAWTSTAGLLAEASKKSKKGAIAGIWNTSEEIGYIIGPITGGLLAQYSNISMPFTALGILMILTVMLIVPVIKK